MKVAIVYDRVNKWGGAERVLLSLHRMFPKAPLYTSVYNKKTALWAKVFPTIYTSFLQKIPFAKNNHEYLAPFMPFAFESFDFSGYDLVISVTSEAAKGIITKPGTLHICYCLTPTRYLWSHYDEYFKGATFKGVAKFIVRHLRRWDSTAASRPDFIIAISGEVKNRINKYYKRRSDLIFPPVDLPKKLDSKKLQSKYHLVVSRLVKYKKVDLVVEAFNRIGKNLVVVGTGKEEKRLKNKARDNVKFVGEVGEKELAGYYSKARTLIIPQEEDFGIVALEAQAYGVPVIAYEKGGVLDTVIPGKTGLFFKNQSPESIIKAVKDYDTSMHRNFVKRDLIINAKRFTNQRFRTNMIEFIKKVLKYPDE